jgi:hypothetical protein
MRDQVEPGISTPYWASLTLFLVGISTIITGFISSGHLALAFCDVAALARKLLWQLSAQRQQLSRYRCYH